MPPRTRLLYLYLLPPAALLTLTYTTHRTLTDLEHKYPAIPASQGSTAALTTPTDPSTQRCAEIDIYQARVPVRALLRAEAAITGTTVPENLPTDKRPEVSPATLQKAWAHLFLTSPILQTEAKLLGLCTQGTFHPGDVGLSAGGFAPVAADPDTTANNNNTDHPESRGQDQGQGQGQAQGQAQAQPQHKRHLINGGFTVERPPEHPGGLLASWRVPDGARRVFEALAHWGYPCRLMSGGRHEWGVSEVYLVDSEGQREGPGPGPGEWVVDVRFGSAHDYEIVAAEGERQKVVPRWVGRLHRGYARVLVEDAVRRLGEYD
ncbi:hypothetical protein BP00DRAFT_427282 [Aspergillus indologenus CBS 114.80]|uniref:Uncharacterized protein n=1 Tax=Aspergillus indologenus CBS 114.80 TaxID=1450541 RepID=A0A2V5I6H3_9EURO|nr:hypothetical protein BP00DRAFT_427282 [Aspergillus indologenus CBS 114.80]